MRAPAEGGRQIDGGPPSLNLAYPLHQGRFRACVGASWQALAMAGVTSDPAPSVDFEAPGFELPALRAYEIDPEPIGIGAFGSVHFAWRRGTSKMVAIKAISKARTAEATSDSASVQSTELLRREVDILREMGSLRHRNLPRFYESCESDSFLYVVQQLCSGGELSSWLEQQPPPYSEALVARITYDLLQAVACCHDHSIVHRDIKPGNILVADRGRPPTSGAT